MKKKFDMQEQLFAQSLKNGELHGFEYFFWKYSKELFHFAYNLLKSAAEAEEIVQNVFLKVWERRSQIDADQPFRSYLFTIALNDIRKLFIEKARQNKFKIELFQFLVEQGDGSDEEYNFARYLKLLDEEIDRLPEKRKEIFCLLKKEGLTVAEAAHFLGVSPKTVENQLTQAIKSIRNAFHEKQATNLYLFSLHLLQVSHTQFPSC
ncbi:RNA polymerase sigma factor [Sunxiuqinia sp. sy24]|uniref:RNA polymerase sigma factor n=1 Tax=Sunxiuqinia sp. sy24 TaxID=3461495 RepID=UPI004045E12C